MTLDVTPMQMIVVATKFWRVIFSPWNFGANNMFQTRLRAASGARNDCGASPNATKSRMDPRRIMKKPRTQYCVQTTHSRKQGRKVGIQGTSVWERKEPGYLLLDRRRARQVRLMNAQGMLL
jgi:hypothetical protein